MGSLVWDKKEDIRFESGIEQGVLYTSNSAVPWNGLISLNESRDNQKRNSYYLDGVKYIDEITGSDFKATLTAYQYPQEFENCLGNLSIVPGVMLTRQNSSLFGLAYKTKVNDSDYKIHLLYNLIALPTAATYATTTKSVTTTSFVWDVKGVPPFGSPDNVYTVHLIVHSKKVPASKLLVLENELYGSESKNPRLPSRSEIIAFLGA